MIREQNYVKVAEYTQKAFQVFCKRVLASRILTILDRPKLKKEDIPSESEIQPDNNSILNQFATDKQNLMDENDSISKNMRFTKQVATFQREITRINISKLTYGEYVCFDVKANGDSQCRVCSALDTLKLMSSKESTHNFVNLRRSCFEICSPTQKFEVQGESITSNSMICLKNLFTNQYIHLNNEISKTTQFGYEIKLKPNIDQSAIFRFSTLEVSLKPITTDQQISIISYYRNQISLAVSGEKLQDKMDQTLIGSYNTFTFKINKIEQPEYLKTNPYYSIRCVGINRNISIDEPDFSKLVSKKEFNKMQFEVDPENNEKEIVNHNKIWKYYEFTSQREDNEVLIEQVRKDSLCQIWQIEKLHHSEQNERYHIKNVILNQPLRHCSKDSLEGSANFQQSGVFHFKKKQQKQLLILNEDDTNLTAYYDHQTERYILKFDQQFGPQSDTLMGKCSSVKFELIEFQPKKSALLQELIELKELLKSSYPYFEKWGFKYEEKEMKIKYYESQLRSKLNLLKERIKTVKIILQKLKYILQRQENNLYNVQSMIKQLKILEILIYYCRIIKLKIGKDTQQNKSAQKLASCQMKQALNQIFDLIYYLIFNNKVCSQIIIQNSKFFSYLLLRYPEPIGLIIEEAIKNLCLLTNKSIQEEDDIFRWTNWIQPLSKEPVGIQKKYIDIIAEVVIDPNDIGILPYQYKIKEQLLSHRTKKKIIPKFGIQTIKNLLQQPIIIFEYDHFPLKFNVNINTVVSAFELRLLFKNRMPIPEYSQYVGYIGSLIKLMRNLCKDKNKKLAKIIEQYGLTQSYMNLVFKNSEIGWQIIARFLDLYCSIHIVQDPFLSFQKRQVKCYSWHKISNIDFSSKTAILFNQFTEQNLAQQKLKMFDNHILPLLDRYFQDLSTIKAEDYDQEKENSFLIIVNVLYEIVDNGYLNHKYIQKYVKAILNYVDIFLKKEGKREKQQKLIAKIVRLMNLAEQIWTIIQGMSLLKTIYNNLKDSKASSIEYLVEIFLKGLNHDQQSLEIKKRRPSMSVRSSRGERMNQNDSPSFTYATHPELDTNIIQFTLIRIVNNKFAVNSVCLQQLMDLLQLICKRGERICSFLSEVFILNNTEEEKLYLEYSGISPLGVIGDASSSSGKLQNVMKVKELVDKITAQNGEWQDPARKKEKILELNNLLMKIINNLMTLKQKHYQLFHTCQILLQKLKLHQILIQVLKFYDKEDFQSLINKIITFYIEFIDNNVQNQRIIAVYFPHFTKRYSYDKLPQLLPILFTKTTNQDDSFWQVYRNLDKKMESSQKEIVFQCIYRMIKVCPKSLFQDIKGQIIYSLLSNSQFINYINGQSSSPSFVSLLCLVGHGSAYVAQKISQSIKKSQLLQKLKSNNRDYYSKWIYLKLYHYLFIDQKKPIDQIECQFLVSQIILDELKHLPASCHSRASHKLEELELDTSMSGQERLTAREQMKHIVQEYSNLMMQGSEPVPASQEEYYFIYLLNIQNEKEMSLLVFLQDILIKYHLVSIDLIANYIFKIINFMERIFLKEQKAYQSRILNKLYEISVIIQQKYNRVHSSSFTLTFEQSKPKVESFFVRLSSILQKERVSYFQLLSCANITSEEIEICRRQGRIEKLILQSEFFKFMSELSKFLNNRGEYSILASENNIKEFFSIFKEKNSHKINIIYFLAKLIEKLQFDKSINLIKIFGERVSLKSEQYRQKQLRIQDKAESQKINCGLLKYEISYIRNTYEMHLRDYMYDQIRQKLKNMLDLYERRSMPELKNINFQNILDLHMKSENFSIMHLIVFQIFHKFSLAATLESISYLSWDKYCKFICQSLEVNPDVKIIEVLKAIYEQIETNHDIIQLFSKFMLCLMDKIYGLLFLERNTNQNLSQLLQKKILTNPHVTQSTISLFQEKLVKIFVHAFNQYTLKGNMYQCKITRLLLDKMIESPYKCQIMAETLSHSNEFILNFLSLLNNSLNIGLASTNIICQNRNKLANNLLKLIRKLNMAGYEDEVAAIVAECPFKFIYDTIQNNYSYIVNIKKERGTCNHQQNCSLQYCNDAKQTDYDQEMLGFLVNFLIFIHISSSLIENISFKRLCKGQNMNILTLFHRWKLGMLDKDNVSLKESKYLKIISSIEVNLADKKQIIFFNIPFMEKFCNEKIQQQMNEDLVIFKKQNFFQNIYWYSTQIQQKLKDFIIVDRGFFARLYIGKLVEVHYIQILYLCLVCINLIFTIINIHLSVLYIINTVIIIMKGSMLALDIRRFIHGHALINKIAYSQSIGLLKYGRLILSIAILISYIMHYVYDAFYPITLCLQFTKVKRMEHILTVLFQSTKAILMPILYFQSFLIICCFYVYLKGANYSFIDIYSMLSYEIALFHNIYINKDIPNTFVILNKIEEMIIFFYIFILFIECIFISKAFIELKKITERAFSGDKICQVCNRSKEFFESKGINFSHHTKFKHNIWSYIYYFIYIRQLDKPENEDKQIKSLIEKEDFRFLKIDYSI